LVIFLSPGLRDGKQRRLYFSSNEFVVEIFSSPKSLHGIQRMTLVDYYFFFILFGLVPTNYRRTPTYYELLQIISASDGGNELNPTYEVLVKATM